MRKFKYVGVEGHETKLWTQYFGVAFKRDEPTEVEDELADIIASTLGFEEVTDDA